jgi:methyltransferase (TIGR00027 family)
MALLRDDERVPVVWVRDDAPPAGWRARTEYEMVRAGAEVIVPRTMAIDDAVREKSTPQLVIVGAGLDGRAHRLPGLDNVDVFEVDHPASQADKRDRAAGLPPPAVRSMRYVPVDFSRERLDAALDAAGHRPDVATTWIWEGVIPYLRREEVAETLRAIARGSASGSRLIVNYQAPAVSDVVGRIAARIMLLMSSRRSPWADEPRRSAWTPEAIADLLSRNGFAVERDDSLLALAERLGLAIRQRHSLRNGHVAVADRQDSAEHSAR